MTEPVEPPYSRLRRSGDLWLTAGILGQREGALVAGGTRAELSQALANLDALLAGVDLGPSEVVRLGVYLTDIADIEVLNELFVGHFEEPRPTRTTVAVAALPGGAAVEIEATAARATGR